MAIVEAARTTAVTGGVDTHLDLNVAAALDSIGGLLGVEEFPTTADGHEKLLCWLVGPPLFAPAAAVIFDSALAIA
jgi:hypothetical protein